MPPESPRAQRNPRRALPARADGTLLSRNACRQKMASRIAGNTAPECRFDATTRSGTHAHRRANPDALRLESSASAPGPHNQKMIAETAHVTMNDRSEMRGRMNSTTIGAIHVPSRASIRALERATAISASEMKTNVTACTPGIPNSRIPCQMSQSYSHAVAYQGWSCAVQHRAFVDGIPPVAMRLPMASDHPRSVWRCDAS